MAVFLAHGKGLTHESGPIVCKVHEETQEATKRQGGRRARRGGWRAREHETRGGGRKPEISDGDGTFRIWLVPDRTVLPNRVTVYYRFPRSETPSKMTFYILIH